jgi:hypothetical protein
MPGDRATTDEGMPAARPNGSIAAAFVLMVFIT